MPTETTSSRSWCFRRRRPSVQTAGNVLVVGSAPSSPEANLRRRCISTFSGIVSNISAICRRLNQTVCPGRDTPRPGPRRRDSRRRRPHCPDRFPAFPRPSRPAAPAPDGGPAKSIRQPLPHSGPAAALDNLPGASDRDGAVVRPRGPVPGPPRSVPHGLRHLAGRERPSGRRSRRPCACRYRFFHEAAHGGPVAGYVDDSVRIPSHRARPRHLGPPDPACEGPRAT